jgi:hypothetical protein
VTATALKSIKTSSSSTRISTKSATLSASMSASISATMTVTVIPSSVIISTSTPNVIYYNDNEDILSGLATHGFYGAIFGSIVGLLGVCIVGFGLDKSSHDKFLIELKKNKQIMFIYKTYNSNLFDISRLSYINRFISIPYRKYNINKYIAEFLIENRFLNWILAFNAKYNRICRLLTISVSILTLQFFIGLLYSGNIEQGFGWLSAFICAILYVPVVAIIDICMKSIGLFMYNKKYIGLAGEEKSIIEFEGSITKDFINNILDDMYQYKDAIKSFIDTSKLSDVVDLMKQISISDIRIFSNRIDNIIYNYSRYCYMGCGVLFSWSIWCCVYFIKYVCYDSVDKGIFVIKSTSWSIILIVLIVEPIMYIVRKKLVSNNFSLYNSFNRIITNTSNNAGILNKGIITDKNVTLHTDAVKVLYYIYRNINNYRENNKSMSILDGSQIINITDIITNTE